MNLMFPAYQPECNGAKYIRVLIFENIDQRNFYSFLGQFKTFSLAVDIIRPPLITAAHVVEKQREAYITCE
jgi:hypothetical protein